MKITLSTTFTEEQSDSLTSEHTRTRTISMYGEPAEFQRAIDEMFDAEQATALRRMWGLKRRASEQVTTPHADESPH